MKLDAKSIVRTIVAYGVIRKMDRVGEEQASLTPEQINARETPYPEWDWSRIIGYSMLGASMIYLMDTYALSVWGNALGDWLYYTCYAILGIVFYFDGFKDIIRLFRLGWVDDLARLRMVMWWTVAGIGRIFVYVGFPMLFVY
jgi:hypothetical protein